MNDTDNLPDDVENEQLSLVLQELKSLKNQNQQLQEELKEVKKLVRGGDQPTEKLTVIGDQGGPGHPVVGKIMREARDGPTSNGVEVGMVETILDDEGFPRQRKATLNIMRKISNNIDGYRFRSGNAGRPSELFYNP